MQKKAKISLQTKEENITEKVNIKMINNKINYVEKNTTNCLYDIENKILIRENTNIYMEYDFSKDKALVYLKDLKQNINLVLQTKKIINKENKISIEYLLDNELYKYIIEMED